ncbi:MAG: NifU family protein [Deltaproteobacteria bacterium]|nr:NifU family protein [Deltaproteobacteria bacterium]
MSLMSAIKSALGFPKPLVTRDDRAPLQIGAGARAWLASLPPGQGVHFDLVPIDLGWGIRAEEGDAQGPPPPELDPLPVSLSDPDFELLRGLTLDRRDDRWMVALDLEVRARETPNPNNRLYLTDRILAVERPQYFRAPFTTETPALAIRLLRIEGVLSVLLRDNTAAVERASDTPWEAIDSEVDAAIRSHFLTCGHAIRPEDLVAPPEDDAFRVAVWKVLEENILPGIHRDGGNLELVGIANGVVTVSMVGACKSCPSSTVTLKRGVERLLVERFPGRIHAVEQI